MASSTSKVSVAHVQPSDWDEWLLVVVTMARNRHILDLIDPDLPEEPPQPVEPRRPVASDVKIGASTPMELGSDEMKAFAFIREDYKYDLAKYRTQEHALSEIQAHILTSIDRQHLLYIDGKTSVYQILTALKKRLAPTDRAREMDVIRQYRELTKAPKRQNIDKWLALDVEEAILR